MAARLLLVAETALFAALFARLGGLAWLPPAPAIAAAAALLLVAGALVARWPALSAAVRRDWRGLAARHGFAAGLAALALIAVLVRVPGLAADLGHQPLDIDEHRVAANVKQFFVTGEIGHRTVEHYPGVLFWMLTGTSLLMFLHGLMDGAFASVRGMPIESFVLAGRVTSVMLGAATVVVTGLIGRRLSGAPAGLLAAGLLAIVPLSVQTTMALRNDPAQVLLVCAAVHAALAACASDRRWWPIAAGLFGGLATGIKYTSVFTLLPALAAAVSRGSLPSRGARAGLTLLAFAVSAAATNHFLWWDFPNFVQQLVDQVAITGPSHWGALENPAAFHTRILAEFGVGWALLVLAGAYGAYSLTKGRVPVWVFWLFPLVYSWFTTKRPSQFPRWVFPLLPFVAVAGAAALVSLTAWLRARAGHPRRSGRALPAAAVLVVAAAILGQPLHAGLLLLARRMATPTPHLVERWLRERPPGQRVLLGEGWLDLDGGPLVVRRVPDLAAALSGSLHQLAANDLVVVPEPYFRTPGLKRLAFVTRVAADQRSFGGNMGYDFEIYSPPRLPPSDAPLEIRFDGTAPADVLGPSWRGTAPDGAPLPPTGASLYLPPRSRRTATVRIEVRGAGGPDFLEVADAAGPVVLRELPSQAEGVRVLIGVVRLGPDGRTTEIRLAPARRTMRLAVIRVSIE